MEKKLSINKCIDPSCDDDSVDIHYLSIDRRYYIKCQTCGLRTAYFERVEDAIDAWNNNNFEFPNDTQNFFGHDLSYWIKIDSIIKKYNITNDRLEGIIEENIKLRGELRSIKDRISLIV